MDKREELFNRFLEIGSNVTMLNALVQNAPTVSDDELIKFVDDVNEQINRLNYLKEDVVRYYQGN